MLFERNLHFALAALQQRRTDLTAAESELSPLTPRLPPSWAASAQVTFHPEVSIAAFSKPCLGPLGLSRGAAAALPVECWCLTRMPQLIIVSSS
jgi:hypothetical protein